MKIQLFLIVLFFGQAVSHGSDSNEEHEPIQYQCSSSNILTVYNRTDEYLITQCSPLVLCGQTKTCTLSQSQTCFMKFQYLSAVHEMPGKSVMSSCCMATSQPDDGEEMCHEATFLDKSYKSEPCDSQSGPSACDFMNGKKVENPKNNQKVQNPPTHKNERQKRTAPINAVLEQELQMFDVKDRHAPTEYIKSIVKIQNGYRIKYCQIQCRSTSTHRPTTADPKTDQKIPCFLAAALLIFATIFLVKVTTLFLKIQKLEHDVNSCLKRVSHPTTDLVRNLQWNNQRRLYELHGKPIIWQYWHDRNMPLYAKLFIEALNCRNPEFHLIVVHDSTIYSYLPELRHLIRPELFCRLLGGHKSDIFRVGILLKYGGVYSDIDVFAIGKFWPNLLDLVKKNYDIISFNWYENEEYRPVWYNGEAFWSIAWNPLGHARANLTLFRKTQNYQIQLVKNSEIDLLSMNIWQSYPIRWTGMIEHLTVVMDQLLNEKSINYYAFDGPKTVAQMILKQLDIKMMEPYENAKKEITKLKSSPVVTLAHDVIVKRGTLTKEAGWNELFHLSSNNPNMFTVFILCALETCFNRKNSLLESQHLSNLTQISLIKLRDEFSRFDLNLCKSLPK